MGQTNSQVTAQDKAILGLKNQRDKLKQYQKRIVVLTDKETQAARLLLAKGDKQKALLALRRKKFQQSLLEKTDAQLEQLQQLTSNVEFALIQKDVVFGLQQGTKVLQEIHREMGGIEHVAKLMDDTAEAIAYQKEIGEMLGGRMSNQDEDEVEDELAALEAAVAGRPPRREQKLPSPPKGDVVRPARQGGHEEQEVQAVQAGPDAVEEPPRQAVLAS